MTTHVKHNGAYASPNECYVKQSGVWTPVKEIFTKHAGAWVKVWPNAGAIDSGSGALPLGESEWLVPYYNKLTVEVAGGGGGNQYSGGGHGKQSRFNSDVPLIGDPGAHGYVETTWWPGWVAINVDRDGAAGHAYGGDTNTQGGAHNGVAGPRGGGAGGLAVKTWAKGAANAPVPGTKIKLVVGAGGGGGAGNGWVKIAWS